MASVTLSQVAKSFGEVRVLHDIDLEIAEGEFIAMVGPSGCGKSTLLRIIAGLESVSTGQIKIDGQVVNDVPASLRGIAMVFQNYALYPHMSVRDNLAFSLTLHHESKSTIDKRIEDTAEFLQLTPYLDRLPKALSGGQRQRVAIGRAIVRSPRVFLFDEPLSNLDAALRVATRIKIADLNDSLPATTMIYVTHDQVEAMSLADRIVVLSADGGIEQVGTPLDLYRYPANLFVARFIGSPAMNILPATLSDTANQTQITVAHQPPFYLPFKTEQRPGMRKVQFGIRPEDLHVATDEQWLIEGKVAYIESLGEVTQLYIDVGLPDDTLMVIKLPGMASFSRGDSIRLSADTNRSHVFDEQGTSLRVLD